MQMRRELLKRFPNAFKPFAELKAPFKVGIVEDIQAAAADLEPHLIRLAVRDYASGRTYHQAAMVPGAARLDMNGVPAGEVTPDQAQYHARRFTRISARNAKRGPGRATGGT